MKGSQKASKIDLALKMEKELSGTIKRGPLSENRKNRLDPVKIGAKRQLLATPWPRPRPPTLRLARGLARGASDGLPILCLA